MLPPRVLAGVQSKPRTCEALGYADQPGTPVRSRHCLQRLASPVSRADSLQPRRAEPTMLMFPHGPYPSPELRQPASAIWSKAVAHKQTVARTQGCAYRLQRDSAIDWMVVVMLTDLGKRW